MPGSDAVHGGDLAAAAIAARSTRSASTSPREQYDEECAYWSQLTGWPVDEGKVHDEFRRLRVPDGYPMRVLLQRLDEPSGPTRAHLDLATDDRAAETDRHVALGAAVVDPRPYWTVLRDPAGSSYCITDRRP